MRHLSTLPAVPPVLICLLQAWLLLVQAGCYHPNGTQTLDTFHAPCSKDPSSPLSTICCAVDRPNPFGTVHNPEPSSDRCLDNGICMNMSNGSIPFTGYWREECTMEDWRSGKCLNLCMDKVGLCYVQVLPAENSTRLKRALTCNR